MVEDSAGDLPVGHRVAELSILRIEFGIGVRVRLSEEQKQTASDSVRD